MISSSSRTSGSCSSTIHCFCIVTAYLDTLIKYANDYLSVFSGNCLRKKGSPLGWSLVAGFPSSWYLALPYLPAVPIFPQKHNNRGMSAISLTCSFQLIQLFPHRCMQHVQYNHFEKTKTTKLAMQEFCKLHTV